MNIGKKGFNSALFLTVFFFIMILAAVLAFLLTDFFNFNEIKQVNLGDNSTSMNLSDVHVRNDGIDFTLNVDPQEKKINGVRFTFETEDNQTKVYLTHISYTSPDKSFFSIDLKEINPRKIKKIIIEPIIDNGQEDSFSKSVENAYNSGGDFTDSDYLNDESSDGSTSSSSEGGGSSSSSSTTTSSDSDTSTSTTTSDSDTYIPSEPSTMTTLLDGVSGSTCAACPSDCACKENEYCSNGACLLDVSGSTYFVSLNGNDSNPGTFEEPFYSWQKGAEVAQAGDIVYFRGGVWMPPERVDDYSFGMDIENTGTSDNPIRFFNYPGERPILDGSLIGPDQYQWSKGIGLGQVEYIHLKGLTVREIHQSPPNFSLEKPYSEVYGVGCGNCANIVFENIVAHDIDGRGFSYWSGAWGTPEAPFESDTTYWINCDAYNLYDRYSLAPGNSADGWKVGTNYGSEFYWIGCRAWNYSDDGFDPHGSGKRVFDSCWAMSTDKYEGLSDDWDIEGNGFKTAAPTSSAIPQPLTEPLVIVKNSIAANCLYAGFYNGVSGDAHNRGEYYNNFAYLDSIGFADASKNGSHDGYYANNIAYGATSVQDNIDPLYEVGIYYPAVYDQDNNTWIPTGPEENWPGWEPNPAYTLNDDDFVSLNYWELAKPRKADGSLPDINFGHLKSGSDLIDGGVIVPGVHCITSGPHPGEDCREWVGSAPDLGPFEYDPEGILNY